MMHGQRVLDKASEPVEIADDVVDDVRVAQATQRSLPRRILTSTGFATLVSLAVLVAIWQAVIVIGDMKPYIMPTPREVAHEMFRSRVLLWHGAVTTLKEVLIGFAIACGVAFPIGIGIAFSRVIERLLYPIVVGSQSVPVVAIAPLFLVWFGFGELPKVLIAALIAFFPIVIGTVAGLRAIDDAMIQMARASGASWLRTFRKIRIPVALPNVFSGLKLAITFSVIGAVVGEFVAGTSGLGYVVQNAEGNQQTELAFAAIIILAAMSLLLFYAVEGIEHWVIRR